ncbi:MAG: selenocysteine-specific translation elongation factor [Planctomycetota bacterium]|nr:selenocysteine-specific translation elongation factor [Planctomycetota bacterium]
MSQEPGIVSVVVGTAGHIDHGKSALVERLTGIHPDRLKEEQDRGLTIDLGFANFALPDGRRVGVVDVPGHERFVKNMVAGASGIDLVLFVVAADDGVMPQTREHLEILELLGLQHGLVVITKVDAAGVDADLLEVLELELRELLEGTFLAASPIVRVSSITGEGFDALRAAIDAAVQRIQPRSAEGAFRMPVQRVFSAQGFGTILTGIPLSGALRAGDAVEVLTRDGQRHKGKVRGLQAYGKKVDRVRAGHSSALNVADVDRRAVERGDAVCTPGIFAAEPMWEVRLTYLPSQQRPLEQRETVRFHVGTSELVGELVLLDHERLLPGESGLAQVRLHEGVVAAPGDRFVMRRHSPMDTLGGGVVLGASKWRLKPFKGFVLQRLEHKEQALGGGKDAVRVELQEAGAPVRADDLVRAVARPKVDIEAWLAELVAEGAAIEASGGKGAPAYVAAEAWAAAAEAFVAALADFHREHPFRDAAPKLELRARLARPEGLFVTLGQRLVQEGRVRAWPQGFSLADHAVALTPEAEALAAALRATYQEHAFQPPTPSQALDAAPRDLPPGQARDVFQHLVERGELVDIGDELVLHRARYEEAKELLRREVAAKGPIASGAFKDLLGSSRRYAIPLLEHFDEVGFTRREGDLRALR